MKVPDNSAMTDKFYGLGSISLISTTTYKFEDNYAFRYCFQTWRVIDTSNNEVESDRFYVWADAVDTAYKYAVEHVYREGMPKHPCIDEGEGGSRVSMGLNLDLQHKEIVIETQEEWNELMAQ